MKYLSILLVLFLFASCQNNNEPEVKLKVANNFLAQDSVEIDMGEFLINATNKRMSRWEFTKYCKNYGISIEGNQATSDFAWYWVHYSGQKYSVGFHKNKMFSFFRQI